MYKYIVTLIIVVLGFHSSPAGAQYIYEYLDEIESLLIEKKYDEADKKFQKSLPNLKPYIIKGSRIIPIYKQTVKWLKKNDEIKLFLDTVNEKKSDYEPKGKHSISKKRMTCGKNVSRQSCYYKEIQEGLPKELPFSAEFVKYINNSYKETFNLFININKKLNTIVVAENNRKIKAEKIELENKRREDKLKREKEISARNIKEKAQKEAISKEIARLNDLAKASGYSGYMNENIISMMYRTQKEGGLEKFVNQVVGCHELDNGPCEKWYPKLKAIQILENGVLYSYSEYSRGEYVNFTIFTDKEPGKLYQEGQALKNSLYVFNGMFSYTTVTGAKKTIPSFIKARLID